MKLLRAHYVSMLWARANTEYPCEGINPLDYGWSLENGMLIPTWFDGPAIPANIFCKPWERNDEEDIMLNEDIESGNENDEQWSGDSDSDDETGVEFLLEQYMK